MTSQDNIMDFMLGGSGGRRRGGRGGGAAAVPNNTKTPSSPSSSCSSRSNNNKKNKKQQEQEIVIKNAQMAFFIKTLVCDWLQTDDDLYAVVQSIYHLRQRIYAISKCQQQMTVTAEVEVSVVSSDQTTEDTIIDHPEQEQKPDNVNTSKNNNDGSSSSSSWKQQGYRGRNNSTTAASSLSIDDWNIGLDHDLLQYERTVSILRKSISKLNQIQDALGRRYDEYYYSRLILLHQTESSCEEEDDNEQQPSPYVEDDYYYDDCQALFTATSIELYRKQCLVEELLDESNHNNLLYKNANDDIAVGVEDDKTTTKNPRTLARRCMEQWSRNYKTSPLQRFAELLDQLQNS